ncbi:hypothetical protein H6P81_009600 [Aristolochia fimbriata]|uniref:Uncharacterized protein n=1 Tax=Aristolochia fimbriata TaxID=158543 RepID=A0AAV7ENE4_ARIFI|nr:hypothetical protein H6P81_009600 [Aristolochia fimbriata]
MGEKEERRRKTRKDEASRTCATDITYFSFPAINAILDSCVGGCCCWPSCFLLEVDNVASFGVGGSVSHALYKGGLTDRKELRYDDLKSKSKND